MLNLLSIGTALGGFMGGYDDARQKQQKAERDKLQQMAMLSDLQTQRQQREGQGLAFRSMLGRGEQPDAATVFGGGAPSSGGGTLAPGFSRDSSGGMARNGQPPDTMLPGGVPAWRESETRGPAPSSFTPPQPRGAAEIMPSGRPLAPQSNPIPASAPPIRGAQPDSVPRPPQVLNTPQGREVAGGIGTGQMADAGGAQPAQPLAIPPELQQQAQQTAQQTVRGVDPYVHGKMSLKALAQQIDRASPDADPAVKMMALEQLNKLLAPSERAMWQAYAKENQQTFQLALKDMQIAAANARQDKSIAATDARQDDKGWTTMETTDADGKRTPVRVQANTGRVEPLRLPGGAAGLTRTGTAAQAAVNPQARSMMADGIANYQLPPLSSWALKSPEGQATMAEVMKKNPEYDATKYTGKQSGARAMGTRSSNLEMATSVAEEQIPLVRQTSERIDRTQFPTINSMILALEKGTGGEDIVRFLEQINTLKYVYARALNPTGVARVADLERFDNILNEAWSKGQIGAALDQMTQSLAAERRGVNRAMGRPGAEAAPSGTPAPATEEVIQNGWRYKKQGDQYAPIGPAQ